MKKSTPKAKPVYLDKEIADKMEVTRQTFKYERKLYVIQIHGDGLFSCKLIPHGQSYPEVVYIRGDIATMHLRIAEKMNPQRVEQVKKVTIETKRWFDCGKYKLDSYFSARCTVEYIDGSYPRVLTIAMQLGAERFPREYCLGCLSVHGLSFHGHINALEANGIEFDHIERGFVSREECENFGEGGVLK